MGCCRWSTARSQVAQCPIYFAQRSVPGERRSSTTRKAMFRQLTDPFLIIITVNLFVIFSGKRSRSHGQNSIACSRRSSSRCKQTLCQRCTVNGAWREFSSRRAPFYSHRVLFTQRTASFALRKTMCPKGTPAYQCMLRITCS